MTDNHNNTMQTKKSTPKKKSVRETESESSLDDAACSPSVSDTPETDAACMDFDCGTINGGYVEVDFARRLERQRDSALCREERLIDAVKNARSTLIINMLIDKSSLSQDTLNSLEWTLDAVCKFHRENAQAMASADEKTPPKETTL